MRSSFLSVEEGRETKYVVKISDRIREKKVFRASNFSTCAAFSIHYLSGNLSATIDGRVACITVKKCIGSLTIIIPKMPDKNFQMSFIPKKYLVTRAIFYPHTHSPTKAYNGTDWIDEIEARKRVLASRLLKKDHTNERDVNSATPCAMTKLKIINADNNSAEEHITSHQ